MTQQYFGPFFGNWQSPIAAPYRCESPPQAACRTSDPDAMGEMDSPGVRTHCPQPRRIVPLLLEGSSPVKSTSPDPSACELRELLGLDKVEGHAAVESHARYTAMCGDSRPVSALSALSTSVGQSSVGIASPSPDEMARYLALYHGYPTSPPYGMPLSPFEDARQSPAWQPEAFMAMQNPLWTELQSTAAPLPPGLLPLRTSTPSTTNGNQLTRTEPPGHRSPMPSKAMMSEPPGLEGFAGSQSVPLLAPGLRWPEPLRVCAGSGTAPDISPQSQPMRVCPSPNLCSPTPQPNLEVQKPQPQRREGAPVALAEMLALQPSPGTDQRKNQRGGKGGKGKAAAGAAGACISGNEMLTEARVIQLSKTQAGSKFLQRKLLKGHPSVIKEILDGLELDLPNIMCDVYGNYLCSAAFPVCSVAQRLRMLAVATRHLKEVATDRWGTHSLQALISLICTTEEQTLLMYSLKESLVELSCDAHGVHAVQRSLLSFGQPLLDVILQEVIINLRTFAHNPHGLGFLKKCISQCRDFVGQQQLIECMSIHALDLVQGPFGNYAVQHALEEWGAEACQPIIQALSDRLVQLSIQKFSSNVVEQMLHRSTPAIQQKLLEELSNPQQIGVLMSTVYGHYVARCALQAAGPEQKVILERALTHGLRQVRNRRLRLRWERVLHGTDEGTDLQEEEADDAPTEIQDLYGGHMPAHIGHSPPEL